MLENYSEILLLVRPETYRTASRTNLFPTAASLKWFMRKHKHQLIKQKAIVSPTGRKLLNPNNFDEFITSLTLAKEV